MADTHIKIKPVTPRVQYTANGSTTVFPYSFAIFDETDMVVYVDDSIITTGYTVSGAGQTDGGNVTFDSAPVDGTIITLLRNVPIERMTDFQEGGTFRPKNINDEFDRQTAFAQQVQEALTRCVKVDPTSESNPEEILPKIERLYDSADNIDIVANDKANVDAVAGNQTNIDECADNMAAIQAAPTAAGNAASSASAAAASAEQAAISAAGTHFKLFHHDWFDYQLNDMAWLRADTFSWQNGTVYTEAYNHLVADYNNIATITAISLDGDTGGIPAGSLFYRYSEGDTTNPMLQVPFYAWKSGSVIVYTYSETPSLEDSVYESPSATGTDLVVSNFINGKQSYSETIGSYTITYYLAADGHKICLPDQETTVQNIYNESGVAWYYILDTANQRFKLPRTKYGFVGLRDTVGKYVLESLPNIKGRTGFGSTDGSAPVSEAFYNESTTISGIRGSGSSVYSVALDASRSSSAYQNNAPVQQRSTQMYLYFYIGQFTQSATEQTAGLNTELFNGKVDLNLNNMSPSATAKETIVGWGMPDMEAGVSISPSVWNKLDYDCLVVGAGGQSGYHNYGVRVSKDGTTEYFCVGSYGQYGGAGSIVLPKGLWVAGWGSTTTSLIKYPLKGVNNA